MSVEVADQYENLAGWFDTHRNKGLVERPYLESILRHAPSKGRVLDLGCGTGEPMAAFFISRGFHVTGIDIAPAMVEMAKSRYPQHDWHVGDMRRLDIEGVFDVVLAWDSFFHLDRDAQREFIPAVAKRMAKDATLLFNTGGGDGETFGEMEGLTFHYASLDAEEYKALLEKAGMEVIVHARDDENCGGRTIWLARKK